MKKLSHIFLYFLSIQQIAFCQGGWIKRIQFQNSITSTSKNVIESPNQKYICIGLTNDSISGKTFNRLTLSGHDYSGNFLWRKDFGGLSMNFLGNFLAPKTSIIKKGSYFYCISAVKSNYPFEKCLLTKFNYNGDTIWQKQFIDPNEDLVPQGISETSNGNLLITGYSQNPNAGTIACLLIKADANGNEIWRKKIHKNFPDFITGNSVKEDSASKKIIIVGGQNVDYGNTIAWESNVLMLDSNANVIFQKSLNNVGAGSFLNVIQLKDKNFITCGSWTNHQTQNTIWHQCYVVKFDISGNILWSKKLFNVTPQNTLTDIVELNNGDLVISGVLDTALTQGVIYHLRACLLKLNKSGDLISQRYIGQSFASEIDEYPLSLASTSDNGFIIASMFPTLNDPTPFNIIKVDSSFCDTSALWCQSLALGLNERLSPEPTMHLFPNPANSLLRVRLGQQPSYNSVIIISDLSGRQIQTIHTEKETDINTNNFPNGLYLIQLFSNNLLVDSKKIAIAH